MIATRFATALLAAALLTACASATLPTGSTSATADAQTSQDSQALIFGPGANGAPGGGMGAPGMGGPGGGLLSPYLADLDLTADQQTELQAIDAQGMPGGTPPSGQPGGQPGGAYLQALLTAETLDEAAIRTGLAQAARPGQADPVTTLAAYQGVLTAAQLTTLVAALEADTDAGAAPQAFSLPAGVTLTADQQARYDALTAALAGYQGGGRPAPAAMAAYFETGATAGLAASAYPTDALIAFATSLTATQRASVFAPGVPGLMMGGQPPRN